MRGLGGLTGLGGRLTLWPVARARPRSPKAAYVTPCRKRTCYPCRVADEHRDAGRQARHERALPRGEGGERRVVRQGRQQAGGARGGRRRDAGAWASRRRHCCSSACCSPRVRPMRNRRPPGRISRSSTRSFTTPAPTWACRMRCSSPSRARKTRSPRVRAAGATTTPTPRALHAPLQSARRYRANGRQTLKTQTGQDLDAFTQALTLREQPGVQ